MSDLGLTKEERERLRRTAGEHVVELIDALTRQCQGDHQLAAEWKARYDAELVRADVAEDRLASAQRRLELVRVLAGEWEVANSTGKYAARSVRVALAAAPEATAPDLTELTLREDYQRAAETAVALRRDLAAANARVAELRAELDAERERTAEERTLRIANTATANARADAAERAKAEWERLRNEAYALYRSEAERRERAESEAAALRAEVDDLKAELVAAGKVQEQRRAEVERLRTDREQERRDEKAWRDERRTELAAANALLERARLDVRNPVASASTLQLIRDINAHLSGQAPARTDLDRAVLEAMGNVPEFALRRVNPPSDWASPARAELARRVFNAALLAEKGNE